MHSYSELASMGASFTLDALDQVESEVIEELQTSGSRVSIMILQMVQVQKAITAIGMFSLFESILQNSLCCEDGFNEAKRLLKQSGHNDLCERFNDCIKAINVLKHGKGSSYELLVPKSGILPFKIKTPSENFFFEGDVSEVPTLIKVDNEFVLSCAQIIKEVSEKMNAIHPKFGL